MRFFGNGIVWDRERNKALCQFEGGALETEDERTVSILTELGYQSQGKREKEEVVKKGRPKKESS